MMIKRIVLLIILATLFITSCDRVSTARDETTIAVVGNEVLTLEDVRNNMSPEHFQMDSLRIIEQYRNNWVRRQLKIREALRLGLDQNENVKKRLANAKETIMVDAYNEAIYQQVSEPVSRSEAQSYYEAHKEKFTLAERTIRYRHMISATLEDAQNARNALQRGRTWSSVAGQYSVNPQQALAISRQYQPVSIATTSYPQMNSFLQLIGVTEISPIRRIDDHFHFVQLMESRDPGEHPEIEWIIDQIMEWMTLDRRRKYLRSIEQNLFLQAQANNEIQIYDVKAPNDIIEMDADSL